MALNKVEICGVNTSKLPVLKTTAKYQAAADEESLILLKDWCKENKPDVLPLLDLIHEYRKWNKIKSTYIDGFIDVVNRETDKILRKFILSGGADVDLPTE